MIISNKLDRALAAYAKERKPKTVREFSRCGPCLTLGPLVSETALFYCYQERDNTKRRIRKRTEAHYSPAHVEPCPSCRDHARTQYPDGYMD